MQVADYVADMTALEGQMQELLADRGEDVRGHRGAEAALQRFLRMVDEHRALLGARLSTLGGTEVSHPRWVAPLGASFDTPDATAPGNPVVRALHAWYSAFNHLALGYAILHAVAHRFYDSDGEGNTADLAEGHLRGYAGAAQEINQLIADVVVSALGSAGQECLCQCPSCGLGICLCAPHGTNTLNQAWRETTPAPIGPGIEVRPPRSGSAAAQAGLGEGDRIIAAEEREVASDLDVATLQTAIRGGAPGEVVHLDVLRAGSERLQVDLSRP